MPAKFVGIVDAADADAAIDEAIKEFEIKDPSRQKRGGAGLDRGSSSLKCSEPQPPPS
jgi:hypothetical protein